MSLTGLGGWSMMGRPGIIRSDLRFLALVALRRWRLVLSGRRLSGVCIILVGLIFTRLVLGVLRGSRVRRRDGGPFLGVGPRVRNWRGLVGRGLRLGVGGRLLPWGPCRRAFIGGNHAPVPPDRVWWVGPPDGVESRFGWVLPGCGIAVRPLPRLIHRRRFTVLWSRDGTAPASPACG